MADELRECPRKIELLNEAQAILQKLAAFSHAEQSALESGDKALILEIDKHIEHTLGEKERAIGAYHNHMKEHGC